MIRVSEIAIPGSRDIQEPYFDGASRLVFTSGQNTFALNCSDGSFQLTNRIKDPIRYSDDCCIGICEDQVVRWNYVTNRVQDLDAPNIGRYSTFFYDHEHDIGVLANRPDELLAEFFCFDSGTGFQKLLQSNNNEFLLGLMATEKGVLAYTGVDNEFDITQLRYLDRFDKPIRFRYRTILFPKYLYRYQRRPGRISEWHSSHRIVTNRGRVIFEVDARCSDPYLRMKLDDGMRFICYLEGRLLLMSAVNGQTLAQLPKRASPLTHCAAGNFILGVAHINPEYEDDDREGGEIDGTRDYWLFDLSRNAVAETIRLPYEFDLAIANYDGSKILLYETYNRYHDTCPSALLLDRMPN